MASNFEFYSPTRVIFGKGTEQRVGALVREYGGTRVLIVYGGKSAVRSGVLDRAENSLAEAGISSWTLGGVVPNPHLDKVYEGIRIGKENSIDFLLASSTRPRPSPTAWPSRKRTSGSCTNTPARP